MKDKNENGQKASEPSKSSTQESDSSKPSGTEISLDEAIAEKDAWPMSRDVFYRPDRYEYVKKLNRPAECVFCRAKELGVGFESLCLYDGSDSLVVLNKYPYNTGHILVMPREHLGDLSTLSDSHAKNLYATLHASIKIVQAAYGPAGINVGMNHGKVAGAGIPDHLHWHIIPRWSGDTNFFPLIAETKLLYETLEQSYSVLRPHFESLKES